MAIFPRYVISKLEITPIVLVIIYTHQMYFLLFSLFFIIILSYLQCISPNIINLTVMNLPLRSLFCLQISSISNLFKSPSTEEREAAGDDAPPVHESIPESGPSHWLYVNVVFTEMQIFIPVIDAEMAEHMANELWGDFAGNSTAGLFSSSEEGRNSFQRIADLALATMLLDSTSSPDALALEERGLAISATVVRFGYASGGDGESSFRLDLRELAAFIRDPVARANCILQPFSCSVEVNSQVPEAAEYLEVEKLNRAATLIQRQWRRHAARQAMRSRIARRSEDALPAVANLILEPARRGLKGRTQSTDETYRGRQWRLVDELVMDVASPHTRSLLQSYKRASRDRSQLMFLSQFLTVSITVVRIKAGALTARAAFSHIPFWQTAVDAIQHVVLEVPSSTMSSPSISPAPSIAPDGASKLQRAATEVSVKAPPAKPFRPHSIQVTANLENVAAVLCNDKPETFGAPDVLQLSFCEASLAYDAATMLPDRPANKAARLEVSTYASFLNSGTSRWEPLYDLWPFSAEFVDIKSPMFLSDRKM